MEPLTHSVCRSCRTRLTRSAPAAARAFSSTPSSRAIPPESPHFIDVPQTFQPDYNQRPKQKGYLPTPREIFPRNRPNKSTEAYIDALTRSPKEPVDVNDPNISEQIRYKARMSALRKSHLRSSLSELHARKTSLVRSTQLRSQMKQAESQRLASQPPREDERLTNVSVPAAMTSSQLQHLSPANARALHKQKTANVKRANAAKAAERADQLHTLYMNARHFITTEAQLLDAIKTEFAEDKFGGRHNMNYWQERGVPEGIRQMLSGQWIGEEMSTRESNIQKTAREKNEKERMKRIGERLSGGKI